MQEINENNYVPMEITDEFEEFQLMKRILNGRVAAYIPEFISYWNDEETHIKIGNEEIIIFPVNTTRWGLSKYQAINVVFKVSSIKKHQVLTLKAPKSKLGVIIGKKGWQIQEWAKKLNVKRINVVEEKGKVK